MKEHNIFEEPPLVIAEGELDAVQTGVKTVENLVSDPISDNTLL